MSLYNVMRPATTEEMQGNYEWVVERLLTEGSNHVSMFTGPSGTGKTTLARICAKRLGAEDFDIEELNFALDGSVDNVRTILRDSQHAWGIKVYIIDEIHRSSDAAQQGLLKLLEDIPEHIYFFLITSEPQKVIKPLRDRCARVQTEALSEEDIDYILEKALRALPAPGPLIPEQSLALISAKCGGSGRVALNMLEAIIAAPEAKHKQVILAHMDNAEDATAFELAQALFGNKDWKVISPILTKLKEQKAEGESVRRVLLGYVAAICIKNPENWWAVSVLTPNVYDSGLNAVIGMVAKIYQGGK